MKNSKYKSCRAQKVGRMRIFVKRSAQTRARCAHRNVEKVSGHHKCHKNESKNRDTKVPHRAPHYGQHAKNSAKTVENSRNPPYKRVQPFKSRKSVI